MSNIDKRDKLGEEPFSYQVTKKGAVLVSYDGRQIRIVKGKEADHLVSKLQSVEGDRVQVQLVLAKMTGNFKRGNEKLAKSKQKYK